MIHRNKAKLKKGINQERLRTSLLGRPLERRMGVCTQVERGGCCTLSLPMAILEKTLKMVSSMAV